MGCTAEQTSCTKPGSVSSAERVPPAQALLAAHELELCAVAALPGEGVPAVDPLEKLGDAPEARGLTVFHRWRDRGPVDQRDTRRGEGEPEHGEGRAGHEEER